MCTYVFCTFDGFANAGAGRAWLNVPLWSTTYNGALPCCVTCDVNWVICSKGETSGVASWNTANINSIYHRFVSVYFKYFRNKFNSNFFASSATLRGGERTNFCRNFSPSLFSSYRPLSKLSNIFSNETCFERTIRILSILNDNVEPRSKRTLFYCLRTPLSR